MFLDFAGDNTEVLSVLRDFEKMRKSIKKPMTDRAKAMLVKKLERDFSPEQRIAALEQSINRCWADVYPLKEERQNAGTRAAPETETPDGFSEFWEAYPKHSGIDDAKREWAALAPDEALREAILRAVAWRKGTEPWKEQQGKFVPAPAKWLHDHGWTDYKPPQRSGAAYEGMGPRDPEVEENWDAIMGEQIKAIRGY